MSKKGCGHVTVTSGRGALLVTADVRKEKSQCLKSRILLD